MYSAYKLNKQGDNKQPYHTPFPVLNQSVVPCKVLLLFDLHTGKVVWYSHLFKNFVIHSVKGFSIINEAEILDVFLELLCFLHDPRNVGNLILVSLLFEIQLVHLEVLYSCTVEA